MKKAVLVFGPLSVAGIRVTCGAITLLLIIKLARYTWKFNLKDLIGILPIALVGNIYPYSIQPHLISKYDSSFIAIMISLVPLITIVISIPMLNVVPSRVQVCGVISGLLCMGLLFSDGLDRNFIFSDLLIALTVPLAYASSNTLIKKSFSQMNPVILTALFLSISSFFLLPISVVFESIKMDENLVVGIGAVTILGVLCTGVAILFFSKLIQEQGPLFAGMVTYVIPVIALLWGWVDGEIITFTQIFALLGILGSVLLVQWDTLRGERTVLKV